MNKKEENIIKCIQCVRIATVKIEERPLCIDCSHKLAQVRFMEQQTLHNQLSWQASNLNFVEQQLYVGAGGLLPLTQMRIPPPPISTNYSFQEIKVSDSSVGVINTGRLINLDTSIQVFNNRGDKELAKSIKDLTQAVVDSNELNEQLKKEIVEQLDFIVTEAFANKESQRKGMVKKTLDNISQSLGTVASLMTIWNILSPLLVTYFGL
jgi:hypothetical protein